MEHDRTMTEKGERLITISDERLITISYVAGEGYPCDVKDCGNLADYMAEGRIYCTFHWARSVESTSDKIEE